MHGASPAHRGSPGKTHKKVAAQPQRQHHDGSCQVGAGLKVDHTLGNQFIEHRQPAVRPRHLRCEVGGSAYSTMVCTASKNACIGACVLPTALLQRAKHPVDMERNRSLASVPCQENFRNLVHPWPIAIARVAGFANTTYKRVRINTLLVLLPVPASISDPALTSSLALAAEKLPGPKPVIVMAPAL